MKKILVIDDDKNLRSSIVEILDFYNYDVLEASNGLAGIELVLNNKPDLVICDVMLPEMDGFTVLEILKIEPDFDIPFIFLSARSHFLDIKKGTRLGADAYVCKPFKADDLIKVINQCLS
jgi:DNA-binding response OmpR family regulator